MSFIFFNVIYFYSSYLKKKKIMLFCPVERKGDEVFVARESFW